MDGNHIIETMTPKNFLPTIKENYIKGWEIWWKVHKSLWGTLFIFPYLVGEVLIVYLVISLIGSLFFGSPEPTMPLIIDN